MNRKDILFYFVIIQKICTESQQKYTVTYFTRNT